MAVRPKTAEPLRSRNSRQRDDADAVLNLLYTPAARAALPALTSSSAMDLELYALIGLAMRRFVTSWYSKITDDTRFSAELHAHVAYVTRALEVRARAVDVGSLVRSVGAALERHVIRVRERQRDEKGSNPLPGLDHATRVLVLCCLFPPEVTASPLTLSFLDAAFRTATASAIKKAGEPKLYVKALESLPFKGAVLNDSSPKNTDRDALSGSVRALIDRVTTAGRMIHTALSWIVYCAFAKHEKGDVARATATLGTLVTIGQAVFSLLTVVFSLSERRPLLMALIATGQTVMFPATTAGPELSASESDTAKPATLLPPANELEETATPLLTLPSVASFASPLLDHISARVVALAQPMLLHSLRSIRATIQKHADQTDAVPDSTNKHPQKTKVPPDIEALFALTEMNQMMADEVLTILVRAMFPEVLREQESN